MFKYLPILYAKYYEPKYVFFKTAPHQNWRICLIQRQNLRNFRCPVWKTKRW